MMTKVKKLFRDPFVMLIMAVVLVPAILVAYGISNQPQSQSAVNGLSDESVSQGSDDTNPTTQEGNPQPITAAEQPLTEEVAPIKEVPIASNQASTICDQAKKQAAEVARHQHVLSQIESTYQSALVAANC